MNKIITKFILILSMGAAYAASVDIRDVGPAVAFAYIKGYQGSCTWDLYEVTPSGNVLHADVSASVDTSRPDILYDEAGTRIMRLGHDYGDYPLAVNTQYELRINAADTGCKGTPITRFSTYFQPPPVVTRFPANIWDATSWDGMYKPHYDWSRASRNKWYTVPILGVKYKLFEQFGVSSGITSQKTLLYTKGSGWTGLTNVGNGSTSNYGTVGASTNPLILLPLITWYKDWNNQGSMHFGHPMAMENIGIGVWAGNDTGSPVQVDVCITRNPAATNPTCDGTGWSFNAPSGSVAKVNSTSTLDATDKFFPNAFPDGGWNGWGGGRVPRDILPSWVQVSSISSGLVSITGGYGPTNIFPVEFTDGYLYIPGVDTAKCPNSMCRVESVINQAQVQLADHTITMTSAEVDPGDTFSPFEIGSKAVVFPFGFMVKRHTAGTGNVSMGFKYKSITQSEDVQHPDVGTMCSGSTTTVNSKIGRMCFVRKTNIPVLYFVSDDLEDVHPLARVDGLTTAEGTSTTATGSDLMTGGTHFDPPYGFSQTDGRIFYGTSLCKSNTSKCLYRVTLRDMTDQFSSLFDINYENDEGIRDDRRGVAAQAGNALIENLTPPSANLDIEYIMANDARFSWTVQGIYATSLYTNTKWSAVGISDQIYWWRKSPPNQDTWPMLYAAMRLSDGAIIGAFSTHYNGEPGAPDGMRWGPLHHDETSTIPNTVSITVEYPGNGGSHCEGCGYLGQRVIVKPIAVRRSGSWDTNTALAKYPYTTGATTYDTACDTTGVPAFVTDRMTNSNQCVYMKLKKELCAEVAGSGSSPLTGTAACSWTGGGNTLPTAAWNLAVGDRINPASCHTFDANECGYWTDNDHMMIMKFLSGAPSDEYWVELMRDVAFDSQCLIENKNGAPNSCQRNAAGDWNIPNGWYGSIAAGRNQSKGASGYLVQVDPATGAFTVAEVSSGLSGHGDLGYGLTSTSYTAVATGDTVKDTQLPTFGVKDITYLLPNQKALRYPYGVRYAGALSSTQQSYINRRQNPGYHAQWSLDTNHLNDSGGGTDIGNPRNFSSVSNCTNVYKIDPMGGGYSYKVHTLIAYVGHKVMEDISGPSVDICNAHDYSVVYVQRSTDKIGITQAVNGITPQAGDIYFKAPAVTGSPSGKCWTRIPYRQEPCALFAAGSHTGGIRRFWSQDDDIESRQSQAILNMGPIWPGSSYFYSSAYAMPTGTGSIGMTGMIYDGIRDSSLLIKLPPFTPTATYKSEMDNGTKITVPGLVGATHARIRFGFDPTNFYCTGRAEACVTDTVKNTSTEPFAFIGETLTPHAFSGATSIAIPLPIDLGRAFFYRIEWLKNGTIIKQTATKPIVVN
jgi:hypothetical protein